MCTTLSSNSIVENSSMGLHQINPEAADMSIKGHRIKKPLHSEYTSTGSVLEQAFD